MSGGGGGIFITIRYPGCGQHKNVTKLNLLAESQDIRSARSLAHEVSLEDHNNPHFMTYVHFCHSPVLNKLTWSQPNGIPEAMGHSMVFKG